MKKPYNQKLNTRKTALRTALILAVLTPHLARAQDAESEEIFELSPFTVDGSDNQGYRATSTLAGSRLKTELRDVSTSVSVATEEFMSDLGATNTEDLLIHMTGTEVSGTSGNFSGAGTEGDFADFDGLNRSPNNETRVRGLAGADNMRNFFRTNIPWEGYNIQRIEVNRGANAVLFGVGSPAGLVNSTTKSAVWDDEYEVSIRFGTNGRRRLTVDANQEIIKDKLALRLMAVDNHDEYRQQPTYKDDQRFYGTFTYNPLENTSLTASVEAGSIESNRPRLGAPMQSISQWWDEGQPYVDNTPGLANDEKFVYPHTGETTSVPGGNAGVYPMSGLWGRASLVYPDPNSDQRGVVWGEQYDGSTGDGDLLGKSYRLSRDYFRATSNDIDKDFYKDNSIVDRNIFDYRNHLLEGNMKREEASFDATNLSLQQFFLDRKLGIELSFAEEQGQDSYVNPLNWRNYNIAVDVTKVLRDGVENPNYGRPFTMDTGWGGHREYQSRDVRATAFYELDFRERNKWLGRHILTGVLSETEQTQRSWGGPPYGTAESFAGIGGNSRDWGRTVPIIHYIGDSMADAASFSDARIVPITANQYPVGTESVFNAWKPWVAEYRDGVEVPLIWSGMDMRQTASGSDFWQTNLKSQVAVLQSYTLSDKLVSTLSYRTDDFTDYSGGTPETYENGYLNVDSPDWILSDEAGLDVSESTWTYGLVAHAPDFVDEALGGTRVSLLYSESSNFSPTRQRFNIWGESIGHETGSNQEYGVQFEALEGKLFFRAVQYKTSQDKMTASGLNAPKNSIAREFASIRSAISKGYNDFQPELAQQFAYPEGLTSTFIFEETADADGVLTINADGRNGVVVATMDSVSEGYEFELDYNVNKRWSLRLNAAKQEATSGNIGTDFKRYIEEVIRPMRDGPLADLVQGNPAGWDNPGLTDPLIPWVAYPEDSDGDGLPLRPGYQNDIRFIPNPAPGVIVEKRNDAGELISSQGHIMTFGELIDDRILSTYESVLATEGKPSSELRKWRWNMQTRYKFTEGALKGTVVGGSLRWQDEVAIGYPVTTNDTNGARVIDVENPYMGDSDFNGDLFVSHQRELGEKIDWTIQLNIKNAFNGDDYVAVAVQPTGALAAVRATEGTYWQLSNTFSF